MSTPERSELAPAIAEIKKELKNRCADVPLSAWDKLASFYGSREIPVGSELESPLLPQDKSHKLRWDEENKKYVPLCVPHVMGNDIVGVFITREGKLVERLVHYSSDEPDSDKWLLDEELGETSDERYQDFSEQAFFVLELLRKLSTTPPEQ